ncbi:MAG: asparaginase [Oceanospirillaceae bacterium]|nr:asparaginase [Oceanospirillaceae bacterium]MCP5334129.1 asparaginase [Oceanospirillaceae bacterium]
MAIRVVMTGGTLDKIYNPLNGELMFDESCLPALLQQGRVTADVIFETLFLKDSLEMSDADRAQLAAACVSCPEQCILITHGTDTMVASAVVIAAAQQQAGSQKTVVLTGAMVPHAFKHSDAMFNVGVALGAVQALVAGVYVAMNGQIFPWHAVQKNRVAGVFEAH